MIIGFMPTKKAAGLDRDVLTAALEGLEAQKRKIEEQLGQVRSMLGGGAARRGRPPKSARAEQDGTAPAAAGRGRRKRRKLSAEARARISAAQKKRWAAQKRG